MPQTNPFYAQQHAFEPQAHNSVFCKVCGCQKPDPIHLPECAYCGVALDIKRKVQSGYNQKRFCSAKHRMAQWDREHPRMKKEKG